NTSTSVTDSQTVTEPAISASSATLTTVAEGQASATVTLATFTHASGVEPAGDFTATVDWGSGAVAATVSQPGGAGSTYVVTASRSVFRKEPPATPTRRSSDLNTSTSVTDSQTVTEPAISASSATLATVAEGTATATVTLATFTHASGVEPAGDFTATVDWGSGAVAATVSQPGGAGTGYVVTASRPVFSEEAWLAGRVANSEDNGSTSVTDSQTGTEPAISAISAKLTTVHEGQAS